jgi:hypothetical protein
MKTNLIKLTCGMALLGAVATATAQTTWNWFISDAGSGNSLVTWSVTGSLATPPGVVWDYGPFTGFGALGVGAPGLYVDSYAGMAQPQSIPTLDGSYIHDTELNQNDPFNLYYTFKGSGGGNDYFDIMISTSVYYGDHLTYNAGTQSVLIPVPFSDFNPGTYQISYAAGTFFDTAATANLTVGSVPEPTTMALSAVGGLSGLLLFRRRKQAF